MDNNAQNNVNGYALHVTITLQITNA